MKTVEERAKSKANSIMDHLRICKQKGHDPKAIDFEEGIIRWLKEEQKLTRHACAENVPKSCDHKDMGSHLWYKSSEVKKAIINTKSVQLLTGDIMKKDIILLAIVAVICLFMALYENYEIQKFDCIKHHDFGVECDLIIKYR